MSQVLKNLDEKWMRLALREAQKGIGRTSPNPPVGAVIVHHDRELGRGWHTRAGQPHAEREAIAAARQQHGPEATVGATIYITLEPCSTTGRTGACTDAIIEAGFQRVVYAIPDPNPAHAGAADSILKKVGVDVTSGILADDATHLIRAFAKATQTGLPWIIWKTAMSLDGRITRPPNESPWLSHAASRQRVQSLRAESDAILTSGETIRRDLPRLDLREPTLLANREIPWRVVLTRDPNQLPDDAPLFSDAHPHRNLILPWENLEAQLRTLVSQYDIHTILLECGGRLAGELSDLGLIDEIAAFLTPMVTGGNTPALGGRGWPDGLPFHRVRFERIESDVLLRATHKA